MPGVAEKQQTAREVFREMRATTHTSGKNFALIGMVFSAVECTIESVCNRIPFDSTIFFIKNIWNISNKIKIENIFQSRGKSDWKNGTYAGGVTGGLIGKNINKLHFSPPTWHWEKIILTLPFAVRQKYQIIFIFIIITEIVVVFRRSSCRSKGWCYRSCRICGILHIDRLLHASSMKSHFPSTHRINIKSRLTYSAWFHLSILFKLFK